MGLFTMLRFLTPNGTVSVSEAGTDLSTTAALGQAVENLDTYAARINGTNAATSAMTLDLSAIGVNAAKLRVAAGATPTADGALEADSTRHGFIGGSNGSTGQVLLSGLAGNAGSGTFGTTAPTPTSGTGSFSAATSAIRYLQVGHIVFIEVTVTITTNGTAATNVQVALPVAATQTNILSGRADAISGKALQAKTGGTLTILNYDNTYPGASGETLYITGWYEV